MNRLITALAVGGLLLVGGCSNDSSAPPATTTTITTATAIAPKFTSDEFKTAADQIGSLYKPCVTPPMGMGPACLAAAAEGDALTTEIRNAAMAMPAAWSGVTSYANEILVASKLMTRTCNSPARSDNLADCVAASRTLEMSSEDLLMHVNRAIQGGSGQ